MRSAFGFGLFLGLVRVGFDVARLLGLHALDELEFQVQVALGVERAPAAALLVLFFGASELHLRSVVARRHAADEVAHPAVPVFLLPLGLSLMGPTFAGIAHSEAVLEQQLTGWAPHLID